jgi:hypothetical protein
MRTDVKERNKAQKPISKKARSKIDSSDEKLLANKKKRKFPPMPIQK